MSRKKPMSRRTFLHGAGGVFIGLPFLEAMMPALAFGQTITAKQRYVLIYSGTVMPHIGNSLGLAHGASLANANLPAGLAALNAIRNNVTIIGGVGVPSFLQGQAIIPGGTEIAQHGQRAAPLLAGMAGVSAMTIPAAGQTSAKQGGPTVDQIAAQQLGRGSKFESFQMRMQAQHYLANSYIISAKRTISSTGQSSISSLPPVSDPLTIYSMLFSGAGVPPAPTATPFPSPTATPRPTATPTPFPTATPRPTATPTPFPTATPRPTATATPFPTATPRPTATPTPFPTATPRPSATPMPTATPRPTATATPRPTATPTPFPTATPRPTATPTPFPTATPSPTPNPALVSLVQRKKSVLDVVLNDANRLMNEVGSHDRALLEQHFEEIRSIERSLQAGTSGGGTGFQKIAAPAPGPAPSCSVPAAPDMSKMPLGSNTQAGWSNEILRGQVQADMLSFALACDLTRTFSWALTNMQVHMGSWAITPGRKGGPDGTVPLTDFHDDSHFANRSVLEQNANFFMGMYARVVSKLQQSQDATGSLLDNTVVTMVWDEANGPHGNSDYLMFVAGLPSRLKNGVYLSGYGTNPPRGNNNTTGVHPACVHLATLQALGVDNPLNPASGLINTLGEVTGAFQPLLK